MTCQTQVVPAQASTIMCQVGTDEVRSNALVEALAQLARRAAFNQLRTIEQLGYIVFLSAWSIELVRSLVRVRKPWASMPRSTMHPMISVRDAVLWSIRDTT